MPPTFPGAYTFIHQVAYEQQDAALGTRIAQLAPVERALTWISLLASPKTDERGREDLSKRIQGELNTLQGGITAIRRGLEYLEEKHEFAAPLDHPAIGAALQPKPRQMTRPAQAGYPGIQSAPIDPMMLGAVPNEDERLRRQISMQERYRQIGMDEGMSGGPPRPDTGINQSTNQQNVPTGPEVASQTAMSAATYKQSNNPPYEPTNSDDGTGAILAREGESAGREASGMSGHVGTVRAAGQSEEGARGVTGPGEGSTYQEVQAAARQTVERHSGPDNPFPPQMAAIPAEPVTDRPQAPESETMRRQLAEEAPPAERQQRGKKK